MANTQKPLLCANPPIWAQVRDNTLRDTTNLAQYSFRPDPPRSMWDFWLVPELPRWRLFCTQYGKRLLAERFFVPVRWYRDILNIGTYDNLQEGQVWTWRKAHNFTWVWKLFYIGVQHELFWLCSGGKAESLHKRKGQTVAQPATDQLAEDKSVRALLNNYRNQRPLVLLIDDKYVLFPYNLGAKDITYVVLGFYIIAHAWGTTSTSSFFSLVQRYSTAERQPANNETGYVVRYKFAFRWCDDQVGHFVLQFKDYTHTSFRACLGG